MEYCSWKQVAIINSNNNNDKDVTNNFEKTSFLGKEKQEQTIIKRERGRVERNEPVGGKDREIGKENETKQNGNINKQ